jgi:hypothetical protein
MGGIGELARTLALPLGMTTRDVERHLDPLVRGGNIRASHKEDGKTQWEWAEN